MDYSRSPSACLLACFYRFGAPTVELLSTGCKNGTRHARLHPPTLPYTAVSASNILYQQCRVLDAQQALLSCMRRATKACTCFIWRRADAELCIVMSAPEIVVVVDKLSSRVSGRVVCGLLTIPGPTARTNRCGRLIRRVVGEAKAPAQGTPDGHA